MEAGQALADLTEVSAQIQAAVLAEVDGRVIASTFSDEARAARVADAARRLLRAAEEMRADGGREALTQLQAATAARSVFLVRDERRLVAAITGRDPTTGLVFYDLKTCLRLLAEEEEDPRA